MCIRWWRRLATFLEKQVPSDGDLKRLFSNSIQHKYMLQKKKSRSKRYLQQLLMDDPGYKNAQTVTLKVKQPPQSAACRNCRFPVMPGELCFQMDGVLTVEYQTERVVDDRKYYFHANHCVTSSLPPWTNMRKPSHFTVSPEVTETQTNGVLQHCTLAKL